MTLNSICGKGMVSKMLELDRIIFLDMDEVLVDFIGGACQIHGITKEEMYLKQPLGEWDITKALRLSQDAFWNPINQAGVDFWLNLQPTPWCDELRNLVFDLEYRVVALHILSSPSFCPTCYDGKTRWLKQKFGYRFTNFVITPHKWLFAGPGRILIDDRAKNCGEFDRAGGKSILFPHRGNYLHHLAHDPVSYVKEELSKCT